MIISLLFEERLILFFLTKINHDTKYEQQQQPIK